ncbi:MAG: right-handed parallel beta-helix repeat-containing protein [Pirellulaceae bacterium]
MKAHYSAGICAVVSLWLCFPDLSLGQSQAEQARRQLGLVGDGIADDSVALQRLIATGGDVHLPAGTYRITRSLVVDLDQSGWTTLRANGVATLQMAAAGPAIKVQGTHFKSADPEGYEDRVWQQQRMPLIDSLAILGAHPDADGIHAVGTMQLTITRVHIRNCRHAIHLAENNRNVIISDSHLYENRGVGIFYDKVNLHQSNITGSHISYNGGGGIVSLGGNVRNIHITGCDIESNMSSDSPPTANVLIDCRESTYGTAEVAITGCTIQHNHTAFESANIRVIGSSLPVQRPATDEVPARAERVREGNITITGNVLSDVVDNIHLQNCRGVTLTGNTLWMGYRHNLLIEQCSHIVIGPNNLDRNPRYDYGDTADANNSVVIRDSEDCTITGLHISNVWRSEAGMVVRRCRRMNISNCTILDCGPVGLLLDELQLSRVSNCLVRDDRPGADSQAVKTVGGEGNQID